MWTYPRGLPLVRIRYHWLEKSFLATLAFALFEEASLLLSSADIGYGKKRATVAIQNMVRENTLEDLQVCSGGDIEGVGGRVNHYTTGVEVCKA